MKILIASFTYPPNKDGVSESSRTLADGLHEKGWHVEIATLPVKERVNCDSTIPIHEFDIRGGPLPRFPYSCDINKYVEFLKKEKYDIIIFNAYISMYDSVADILETIPGKKILVSHGSAVLLWVKTKKFPYGIYNWLWNLLGVIRMPVRIRKLDHIVFLSKKKDLLTFIDHSIASLFIPNRISVIPNGVDLNSKTVNHLSFRNTYGIKNNETLFLYVGYYSKLKDQGFALKAFLKANIKNSVMVFIGSKFNEFSDKWQSDNSCISENTMRVIWLEKLDRCTTLDAISSSDFCVMSSKQETQPIFLLEAMRASKPWIARRSGCINEMPGGVCVKTIEEMADAMRKISFDRYYQEPLAREGRHAIERIYNRDSYISSYTRLIKGLIP
jgi:glycosyltransferase involved in cell wall biosynthesis